MNTRFAVITAVVSCLWVAVSVSRPAAAAKIVPQKQSLEIPLGAKASRSIKCVVTFGPATPTSALAFSPGGEALAVGGYREVLIWDLAGATLRKRIGTKQISGAVGAVAFLEGGKLLAVGEGTPHSRGAVRIFDTQSGDQAFSFQEPQEVVYSLAASSDGKFLAAAGAEKLVRVWNLDEKKLAATINEHGDWVMNVAFSPDGKLLSTASADRTLKLWEVGTWDSAGKLTLGETVRGSAFSPDGLLVAIAFGGPQASGVQIYRTADANLTRRKRAIRILPLRGGMPMGASWTAKGDRIYVPCSDNTVKAFDARNGRPLATLTGHRDWVYSAALSPDGTKLASGSADGTVKLWSTADGKLLATLVQLSPRADQWLILTAEGYLATSSAEALKWKTSNVKTPAHQITGILHKPELVRKVLAAEKTDPPALD